MRKKSKHLQASCRTLTLIWIVLNMLNAHNNVMICALTNIQFMWVHFLCSIVCTARPLVNPFFTSCPYYWCTLSDLIYCITWWYSLKEVTIYLLGGWNIGTEQCVAFILWFLSHFTSSTTKCTRTMVLTWSLRSWIVLEFSLWSSRPGKSLNFITGSGKSENSALRSWDLN